MIFKTTELLYRLLDKKDKRELVFSLVIMQISALLSAAMIVSLMLYITLLTSSASTAKFTVSTEMIYSFSSLIGLEPINFASGIAITMVILNQIAQFMKTKAVTSFAFKMQDKLSTGTVDLLLSDTYYNASRNDPSKFSARVTTLSLEATTQFVAPLLEAISSIAMLLYITLSLMYISMISTIFIIVILVSGLYFSYRISRFRIQSVSEGRLEADRMKHSLIQEILHNLRLLFLSNSTRSFPKKVRATNQTIWRSEVIISQYSIFPKLVIEGIAYLALVIGGVVVYRMGSASGILDIIPLVGTFAIALQRMMPELQRFYTSFTRMKYGAVAFSDIARDLVELENIKLTNPIKTKITDFRSIDIDGLRYEDRRTGSLLFDTNEPLQINCGDKIGILAPSGDGKSTLLDIICGLIPPDAGHIRYNVGEKTYNSNDDIILDICYIPQAVTMLNGSLAYNIALKENLTGADLIRIRTAIEKAQIDSIKFGDPEKVVFSDNGKGLSGGERQRIGLARAFFQSSEITILDEATSAIDKKTEQSIISNISELNTVIIVTHNPELLNFCNTIIRITEKTLEVISHD